VKQQALGGSIGRVGEWRFRVGGKASPRPSPEGEGVLGVNDLAEKRV
jgi:hypothetical protein